MGTPASPPPASVVPAQLGFLAIFNPSLGATDDTLDDQIVYYASVDSHSAAPAAAPRKRNRSARNGRPTEALSPEERNERLRQIGLAQGMLEFSRGFAGGKTLDSIETEKSRVVLHELEPGWWILASIDLTKLPLPPRLGNSGQQDSSENVEYSSREVKPAALLMQDLLRAHSMFLLHHAASLSALFVRTRRPKFVAMLSRYWDIYLSTWNVMLHGVGEEERGSGEREVLEGFVGRIDGLVDLVVSKFGDAEPESTAEQSKGAKSEGPEQQQWLGLGEEPGAEDGAIFLGTGALSKNSLRDIVYWMEDLFTWGEGAYGALCRTRSQQSARKMQSKETLEAPAQQNSTPNGSDGPDANGMDKFVSYLKLGYGTHWSLGSNSKNSSDPPPVALPAPPASSANGSATKEIESRPELPRSASKVIDDAAGHYLIGLKGAVDDAGSDSPESDGSEGETRTLLRTLTVELESEMLNKPENEMMHDLGSGENELRLTKFGHKDSRDKESHFDSQDRNKTKKVRVVVYPRLVGGLDTHRVQEGGSMTMNAIAEDHEPPRLTSEESNDSTDAEQSQESLDSVAVTSEQTSRNDAAEEAARSISVHQHQKEQQERREKHRKHGPSTSKEIVLIRRAGEHGTSRSRSGSLMSRDGEAAGWTEGASRLAQGIGVDTRKYIDELISMGQ
ncbi:uncharacterized protein PG998_013950 [Apiospora kogelbergensis]|uniref:uncharacterized protein n=1 Tax=Apiospora kogelbergensis TaxID=1337665 RepID=UPI0031304522